VEEKKQQGYFEPYGNTLAFSDLRKGPIPSNTLKNGMIQAEEKL
jgi:hypothetical protein